MGRHLDLTNLRPEDASELDSYVDKHGYKHIKRGQGFWPLAHHILWEEHHGKVPPGHMVKFIDGDRNNIKIENLRLVSRKGKTKELKRLNDRVLELEIENTELKTEIGELKSRILELEGV